MTNKITDEPNKFTMRDKQNHAPNPVKKALQWFVLLCAVAGIVLALHYHNKYQELKANPNIEVQRETKELVGLVGKLMELPEGEMPTVATIMDKEKLTDQPFFVKAENGDKLLAYTQSMMAILYRPGIDKIIAVAPIYINSGEQSEDALSENIEVSSEPISAGSKIAYYNGTSVIDLASQAERTVRDNYSDYETVVLTDAAKDDYEETLIIDLTGENSEEAEKLVELLGGKISSLPEGEVRPAADILIISGAPAE